MRTDGHAATLIGLLQQLGRGEGALCSQWFVVLIAEARGFLECAHDESDGCELCFAVADLVFVDGKCLSGERHKEL